jgi:hypothetical protein
MENDNIKANITRSNSGQVIKTLIKDLLYKTYGSFINMYGNCDKHGRKKGCDKNSKKKPG